MFIKQFFIWLSPSFEIVILLVLKKTQVYSMTPQKLYWFFAYDYQKYQNFTLILEEVFRSY